LDLVLELTVICL